MIFFYTLCFDVLSFKHVESFCMIDLPYQLYSTLLFYIKNS